MGAKLRRRTFSEHPELLGKWVPKEPFAFGSTPGAKGRLRYDYEHGHVKIRSQVGATWTHEHQKAVHGQEKECFVSNKPLLLDFLSFLRKTSPGEMTSESQWVVEIFGHDPHPGSRGGFEEDFWHTDAYGASDEEMARRFFIWSDKGGTETLAGTFSEDDFKDKRPGRLKEDVAFEKRDGMNVRACIPKGVYGMRTWTQHRQPINKEFRVLLRIMRTDAP